MIAGSVQMLRNSGDQALIIREALADEDHALGGDFIFADILAMVATAHLDNHHDLAKLAVDAYVPKPDNSAENHPSASTAVSAVHPGDPSSSCARVSQPIIIMFGS